MTTIFYKIHLLTKRYKAVSITFFILILSTCLYFASKIDLEENIVNVIPKDNNIVQINKALEGFKMNNRLVFHLYYNDSSKTAQDLIRAVHQIEDSINNNFLEYISELKIQFPDSHLETMYSYYTRHLPLYLEDDDYAVVSERTTEEGIRKTVENNYRALISPMSMVTKKMLVKDPFNLVSIPLKKTREFQFDDNIQLYHNHLLTKDQRHLIFFVGLANPPNETSKNGAFIAGMDKLIQSFEVSNPSLNIEYFGQTAVSVANANQIKQDIYITVTLAVVILFLFISFFYRNPLVFFTAITPGVFGAVVAIAFLAIVKSKVSIISLGVGSVLLGITIDYALHFFTHYKDRKNIKLLFDDLTVPLLMSSLTTSCAFFSLIFLRSEALADLGIFAGVSVVASALYTLLVLPHLIGGRVQQSKIENRRNFVEKIVSGLSNYPFYKAKWTIVLLIFLSTISIFTWRNYSFETEMLRLNYMPERLAQYEKNLNNISSFSANNIYVITTGASLWEALEKESVLNGKLRSLKDRGIIHKYSVANDIIPDQETQKIRLEKWNTFWQENDRDTLFVKFVNTASQVGFRADGFGGLQKLLDVNYKPLSESDIADILSVVGEDFIIRSGDSVSVISSIKTSRENKAQVYEELGIAKGSLAFDQGYITAHLVQLLQEDFNKLVNLSLIVVFLILLVCYGRIELALLTFAPILLSWLWILGIMGVFDLKFNIVNIIVCTFVFGLGIDYSIFVTRGYTQKFQSGLETISSYKKSILLSAITTLVSIGVLVFAEHPALRSIALLAIIGICSVIFITFTVQPLLYKFFILNRKEKGLIPYTLKSFLLSSFAIFYFLFTCLLLVIVRILFIIPVFSEKKRKTGFRYLIMILCRSIVYIMANVKKTIVGKKNVDFSSPSVIISNHHSFLDIILLLMFNPKVVMVTNDWVYHSPFFGLAVQYADFIPAHKGIEGQLEKIRDLVAEGYSIIIFPEGTRSASAEIGRFHKGAFYLSEYLKLDIQPVILHGTSYAMPKNDGLYLRGGEVTIKFLPRIKYNDAEFGNTYSERTKKISRYFKSEYQVLRQEKELPDFYKETIFKNYLYKGPVLEWYLKIKYRLEQGYTLFHELIPRDAKVYDVGCGYGFLSYSLAFSSGRRQIVGIDYDQSKIEIANNCPVKPSNLLFLHRDVCTVPYEKADVFVVSDVLHYLLPHDQKILMDNMLKNLVEGGKMIIRDGDSSKKGKHRGTALTEYFSTGFGFNKTKNMLCYISEEMIKNFAAQNMLKMTVIDNTKFTSNTIYILEK
ncbi:MAG: MMPL family transporter [Cytophagaceae bacterium]